MKRWGIVTVGAVVITTLVAGPAFACGGLLAPNGTVNLVRTSTLAAYHDGVEHYVTGFEFAGAGGKFGSIIPLPDIPTKVIKGGDWTLQRLAQETQPPPAIALEADFAEGAAVVRSANVILETKIDALDVTVLEGGGDEVGRWAKENGFQLPPDAPEVLDFYAERSPIFMAAKFDAERAAEQGANIGDSTPVHAVIPTDDPWVPLRILGLGKQGSEIVDADVYLLTDQRPAMLPRPTLESSAMRVEQSSPANELLLSDLREDKGMGWLPPDDMWLTYLRIKGEARLLNHDLALNVEGGTPSLVDAGLSDPAITFPAPSEETQRLWAWALAIGVGVVGLVLADRHVASKR